MAKLLQVSPLDWLGHAIEAAYEARGHAEQQVRQGWFRPSSLSAACLRQIQFGFLGIPASDPPSYGLEFASRVGTFVHKDVQELVAGHPNVLSIEQSRDDPVNRIKGQYDLRVRQEKDAEQEIVDLKTSNGVPKEPKPGHPIQLAWYLYLTGLKVGHLLYINRANGAWRRFTLFWNDLEPEWVRSRDRTVVVKQQTFSGLLAPMTPSDQWDCRRCKWRRFCDKTETGDDTWLTYLEETMAMIGESQS